MLQLQLTVMPLPLMVINLPLLMDMLLLPMGMLLLLTVMPLPLMVDIPSLSSNTTSHISNIDPLSTSSLAQLTLTLVPTLNRDHKDLLSALLINSSVSHLNNRDHTSLATLTNLPRFILSNLARFTLSNLATLPSRPLTVLQFTPCHTLLTVNRD